MSQFKPEIIQIERVQSRTEIIKKGQIVGKGTHNELLKENSLYSQMYYKESVNEWKLEKNY